MHSSFRRPSPSPHSLPTHTTTHCRFGSDCNPSRASRAASQCSERLFGRVPARPVPSPPAAKSQRYVHPYAMAKELHWPSKWMAMSSMASVIPIVTIFSPPKSFLRSLKTCLVLPRPFQGQRANNIICPTATSHTHRRQLLRPQLCRRHESRAYRGLLHPRAENPRCAGRGWLGRDRPSPLCRVWTHHIATRKQHRLTDDEVTVSRVSTA